MANPLFEMSSQGQSLASPKVLANLAARTARPGTQASTLSGPYQAPEPQEQPQEKKEQGWGSWAGEKAINTVAAVGNLLDLPGSSVRDVMTGRNPLDQWLDPFGRQAEKNRISGRDMLREKGFVGKEDTWGNFFGGMALEIATDPTTYIGIGALSRAGKAFSSIGVNAKKLRPLAKEMAETGSKKVGPKAASWVGGKLMSFTATPKMVFEHAENIINKNIKPMLDNSVEGTFKASTEGSSAFASKADLDNVIVPPEKAAWAMVDNGQRLEVYKNAKEASEWVLDVEATRAANLKLSSTVIGATPKQLKNQWKSAHQTNYGKKLSPEAYAKILDEDLDTPLRSLASVGIPFMQPLGARFKSNPEQSWNEWLGKQPDLQEANKLDGGPPPIETIGPNAPKPSPKAPPVKDAAKEAAMVAAQEEAAQRSKIPPQQGRDILKQLGRGDLDAIADEDIAKEISRYGLLDGKGNLRTSTLGNNATRALHQAARTFGPNGVDAFPVVETLAKTWGKLNGVDPDEYFKSLNVKAGAVPDGKLGKYVGDPSEIVTQDGVQKIMRMGERVITAMRGADGQAPSVATFMHEIGHDARAMFDSKMQKQMEDAVGAYIADNKLNIRLLDDAGKWTSEAEEIFANGFEAYLATGKPPLKGLAKTFDKIKVFIEDLWRTISGNPKLESYVHPELKKTFDEMLSPGKAKGPKAVAPPATVVSQAADAVDGQADEAAGTKPLQPDQGGGGSSVTPTGLPSLKPGYSRFVHLGRPGMEDSYRQGLDYSNQGMLQSTSRNWDNEADVLYHSDDPRFAPNTAYVYDVPIDETRQHFVPRVAPGKLPGEYYVGAVTREQADAMRKAPSTPEQLADTVRTYPTEVPTTKPNVSDAPSGQADISGQSRKPSLHAGIENELYNKTAIATIDRSGQTFEPEFLPDSLSPKDRVEAFKRIADELGVKPSDLKQERVPGGFMVGPKQAPTPQQNPLVQQAAQAPQPNAAMNNPIQDAAKGPAPIKEIPYSKNPEHNKELNRIHQSLAKTVGDDAAKAITPLVQEFVEAGNNQKVLATTIESMSPEEMAGLAAKIAADKDGAANELLQIAYHGTPHVFAPEMLVRMLDGSEKYLKAGEAIPEGAEAVQNFPLGRFDLSRVSTGEGRGVEGAGQAYGFGAYAAQREGLARDYKKTLAGDRTSVTYKGKPISQAPDDIHTVAEYMATDGLSFEDAKKETLETLNRWMADYDLGSAESDLVQKRIDAINALKDGDIKIGKPGALYKLDVPEDDEVMFWDKPFSEQPPKVQESLNKLGVENKTATWNKQFSLLDGITPQSRSDEMATVFPNKKNWVDDPKSKLWTLGDDIQSSSHGKIREMDGEYFASMSVNGNIERKQFNSLRDAKSWIDEQDHGWEAWIQSDKSYRITEKRAFKSAEDAKKWADEAYPPAQPKGEDIYEQLMGQAKRDASKSEAAVKAINEVKSELKELYSDNPGIADALTDAVDNAMATIGQRVGMASTAVTKVLPAHMQPGELRASGNWDFWNKLSPILQKLDETESKLVLSDFQAKKAASKKLYSVGIKGNAVPENFQRGGNEKGNYNFVVFDDKDIKILDRLEQAGKGSVTFKETGEAAIKIVTGEGDASTAVHELAHVFRRNLKAELSERAEKALEQQLKDKDTIKNILGGKSDAVLKDANGNWTREAEEVWARLFEKYAREGKAPTNALKEAFEALKKMMVNVYKTLIKHPEINGKINPELRAVFDEMLGGTKKAAPGPKVSRLDPIIAAAKGAKEAPVASNPLVQAADTTVAKAPEVPMSRETPEGPGTIAKTTVPNPIEATANKETDRVSELMPNALYETAKQAPSKLPPPRIGGLMARARAVDKEAAKQSAFVPSDELIDAAKEAPAPKAGVQFNAPKDDVLPHVADAESVLGLGKDGGRLSDVDSLPVEKKQVFNELLKDLNGFGEGEREAVMEAVAESLSKAIGREATQEEVQKVANWLDKTSDQFKRTMQRVDKEYVYTPDKLSAKTKGEIGEKLRTLSKKGMGESLTPDEIQPLVEHLGMTPAVFAEGADISEAGIKSAVKKATGVELTNKQAKAASIFMNSDQGSAAKLREAAAKQQKAESVLDRDVGGAPKKIREPYVGGQALEDMPLEESVGKISQAELVKAMAGVSDKEIQAIAKKLADDSGVAVEAKGETVFDPNTTAAKIKERAQDEVKELRKQLRKTTSKSEKRALENQIEEIKEAAKQGKKAAQDGDVQGMYRRMNALKMLATKAKDAAAKDAYTKLANEVRSDIAKEELGRAYRAADGLSKGVEAFRMENQSAINEGMLKLIDQHDYTKLPRIQSKSFWNAIKNEIKPSAVDVMTKRVGDIKDAEKATNFEANIISKKATDPTAGQILEVLSDNTVREKMSQFQQEIIDQARKGASPAEAAEALQMSEEKYISSLKEVMDKITEIAQNRIVQFKDATPAEAAKNVITHKIAQARWSEIIDLVKGSTAKQTLLQALDVGDTLFMANPATRMMVRLFDAEVMGAGTLEEQDIARQTYRAYERSVYAFREILHPIVHYAGRQGFFDHKSIATKLIQERKMDRVAAGKEAQKIIIDRDNELRRYFESKEATKLNHEIFGVSPDQAEEFQEFLDSVKKLFPEDILNKRAAGLSDKELADLFSDYAPRHAATPGKTLLRKDTNKALLDASVDSQISREEHLKNLPGGTPILNAMSLDEAISGIAHNEEILGEGLSKGTMDFVVDHILKHYKDDLLSSDLMKKNGSPTEEGMKKIKQIANSVARLPKDHIEQQVPWFGNNFLRDLSVYFEQSYMKQGVSLAAQRLVVKNMITNSDQKYLLSKFFEQAKMDNHNAYMNIIKQTGRMGDYQRFTQEMFNEWLEKGKITINEDGLLKMGDKKPISPADMAEEMNIAKMYTDARELGVNQETFEAAGYWLQGFSRPQELTVLKQMAAASLNTFKSMVTVPFAAFHGRNKTSGFMQNVFFGAHDPTANFADRYFKTERQAFSLRTGRPIKNIHKELPKDLVDQIPGMEAEGLTASGKDALVTEWVRSQVFKYGLVGDRQGHAAEKIIDTTSSLTSQSPGTVIKDKGSWWGLKNPLLDPTTSLRQKLNPLAFEGTPYPAIDRAGARPKLTLNKHEETTFTLGAVGQEMGSMVEDTNRVSPFLAYLKQGVAPEEAARRVHAVQFDYSKTSSFEKSLKQFIPFYMFTSRALKLTLTDLLDNPGGKQAWSIRAANRLQSENENPTPEHIRRGIAIPLGKGAEGQDRYLSGFGLAWEDPLEMMSFMHGDVKATAASAFSKLRPEIQAIPEAASGRSMFFDKEFRDLDPQVGRLRDNLLMRETKGLADPIMGSQSLEFLIGKSPVARVPSTINGLLDSRKNPLEKLLNATTGVKVTDVNAESAARMQIDQYTDQLKELGGREMKMTTLPDWRKERMTPEELAHAQELQKMIRSIQSDLKERKKQAQIESLRSAAEGPGVG